MTCCRSHRDNVTVVVVHHGWQKSSCGLEIHLNQEAKMGEEKEGENNVFIGIFNTDPARHYLSDQRYH